MILLAVAGSAGRSKQAAITAAAAPVSQRRGVSGEYETSERLEWLCLIGRLNWPLGIGAPLAK